MEKEKDLRDIDSKFQQQKNSIIGRAEDLEIKKQEFKRAQSEMVDKVK
jgi:hypothetical protein